MKHWKIDNSKIHGKGVITKESVKKGSNLGTALINGSEGFKITPRLGKWINHCDKPNCIILQITPNKYSLVAIKNIPKGEEATMSYHETPWYIASPQSLNIPTKFKEKYGYGDSRDWWS